MAFSTRRAVAAAATAVLALGTACGDDGTDATTETTATSATAPATQPTDTRGDRTETIRRTTRCRNEQAGYSVAYPAGWHTNEGDVVASCSLFDPEPFEVPPNQEFTGAAVSIDREPVRFSRVTGEDPSIRVVRRERTQVAGRPAVRRLVVSTGEGLYPEGRRSLQYLVDLDGETLVATTQEGEGVDPERARQVLDAMMESLRITG